MSVESKYRDVEVEINFSAIDNVSMFVASFSNYSDIRETPAYEDVVSLSERLQGREDMFLCPAIVDNTGELC